MQRQTVVDGRVVFLVLDIFPEHPLVCCISTIEAGIIQRRSHRTGQMIQEQEILAHLIDFLWVMDMSVAKLILGRISSGLDEVILVLIQLEYPLAITIHDFLGYGIQGFKTKASELQHRQRNTQNLGIRNPEEFVPVQRFCQRRKPESHRVGIHFEHLVGEVVEVKNIKTLTELVVVELFHAVIACILVLGVILKQNLIRRLRNIDLHEISCQLRSELFRVFFQVIVRYRYSVSRCRIVHIVSAAFFVVDVQASTIC